MIDQHPTLLARLWAKVDRDGPVPEHRPELGPCWLWTGATTRNGYGHIGCRVHGHLTTFLTHRVAYVAEHGEVPAGLDLDHLCRNRACCNPAHLEPVTKKVNSNRGRHAGREQTECLEGHPFDAENTYLWRGHRHCRTCRRERQRASAR